MIGLLIGAAVLVLDVVAISNIVGSRKDPEKKMLWVVLVLLLPFVGMLAYFAVGKEAA